ncbi:MAG: 3-deoxy-manno-octulosonate cytidylyltransferase [Candidatus Omnitrophica bacterium]|nr:3-deoxy-manno-octulosonate cytidylyltransferase [Candidatus Omnitrophota bacterium]
MHATGIIPARFGSTRFPGKPLALLWGKPLIQHVWEKAVQAETLSQVLVATDDERILEAVHGFGGEAIMTSADHPSGSDRVAELARSLKSDIIVNIQGDEPLLEPSSVDAAIRAFEQMPGFSIVTLGTPFRDAREWENPNCVKVLTNAGGYALYFSRAQIPHGYNVRGGNEERVWRHLGLYAYRRDALFEFCKLAPSSLEKLERLEQLRALENGMPVYVVPVEQASIGVDTPEELEKLNQRTA